VLFLTLGSQRPTRAGEESAVQSTIKLGLYV
jgi:hypothetical protein